VTFLPLGIGQDLSGMKIMTYFQGKFTEASGKKNERKVRVTFLLLLFHQMPRCNTLR
jgi:hypothetical protein